MYAGDLALDRHDISNLQREVARETYRRDEDDAMSVHTMVRSMSVLLSPIQS